MKKLRLIGVALCILLSSFMFYACGKKTIDIEKISFNHTELEIPLGESVDLTVSYLPKDATNLKFDILSYDKDIVTITQSKENPCLFTVKAADNIIGGKTTTVGIALKNNSSIQAKCKITLLENYQKLSTPTDVHFNNETNRLEWSSVSVDNFESYTVNVNGEDYPEVYNSYMDFSTINTYDTQLDVKVRVNGKFDFYNSDFSNIYSFKKLSSPKNLQHENCKFTWLANEVSNNYVLNINNHIVNINNDIEYLATSELADAQEYTISVKTIGNGVNIFDSNESEKIVVTRLGVPQNYSLTNNTLNWRTVVGANKYLIKMNNNTISEEYVVNEIKDNYSFKLTDDFLNQLDAGEYTFSVQAMGNGVSSLDGAVTYYETATKLFAPNINISLEEVAISESESAKKNVLKWNANNDASSYVLSLKNDNGEVFKNLTNNLFDLDSDYISGAYTCKVKSNGNGSTTFSSTYSDEIYVYKLFSPDVNTFGYDYETGNLYFSSNFASTYDVMINNNIYPIDAIDNEDDQTGSLKTGIINLNNILEESTSYNISVKAKNNDYIKQTEDHILGYLESEFSQVYTIDKLQNPQFAVKNGELSWNKIPNASDYEIVIYSAQSSTQNENEIIYTEICKIEDLGTKTNYNLVDNMETLNLSAEVVYYLKIRAFGEDNKCATSNYSNHFKIEILQTPTVYVDNGALKINESANAVSHDFIVTINNNVEKMQLGNENFKKFANSEFNVQAVAYGSVETMQDVNYLTSKKSSVLTVYQMPIIQNLEIDNQVLSFDGLNIVRNGNPVQIVYNIQFSVQDSNGEYQDLTLVQFDSGDSYNLQSLLSNYIEQLKEQNVEFKVKVQACTDNQYLLLNDYSQEYYFTKLQTPTLKVSNYNDLLNHISTTGNVNYNDLPGTLKWNSIEKSSNYTLNVYSNNLLVAQYNGSSCSYKFDDLVLEQATYNFKLISNGNGKNIISSEVFELNNIVKYKAPTLYIENGIINWDTDLNNNNTLFVLKINQYYCNAYDFTEFMGKTDFSFADLQKILEILDIPHKVGFPDSLSSDILYDISIFAVPLNTKDIPLIGDTQDYLISSSHTIYQVKKLASSSDTYMKDGKFYFSKVDGADDYNLYINDEVVQNNIINKGLVTEYNENLYEYDFASNYNSIAGEYNIQVKALTKLQNTVHGSKTKACIVNVLPTVEVYIDNGILNWKPILQSSYYEVEIYKGGELIDIYNYENNNELSPETCSFIFDEKFDAGEYVFKIIAKGDEIKYVTNSTINTKNNFTATKLLTPIDVHILNGKIVWSSIFEDEYTGHYNLIINKNAAKPIELTNINSFEMITDYNNNYIYYFDSGLYGYLQIQAMGEKAFLNSDISDNINTNSAYKLATPLLFVKDGILSWNCADNEKVSYYQLTIGEQVYIVGDCLSVDLANGFATYKINDENNAIVKNDGLIYISPSYAGTVKVQAIGSFNSLNSGNYLNSDYSNIIEVNVLANVSNISITNGELTWTIPNNHTDNLTLVYKNLETLIETSINTADATSYTFNQAGRYEIYFVNKGNSIKNAEIRTGYYITSKKTLNYFVEKLETPSNLNVEILNRETGLVKLTVQANENANNYVYVLDYVTLDGSNQIKFISSNNELEYYITNEEDANGKIQFYFNTTIDGQVKKELITGTYSIKVMYLGDDVTNIQEDTQYYLNSNYSESVNATIPSQPNLKVELTSENEFSGKIYWDSVTYITQEGQTGYADEYLLTVYYSEQPIDKDNLNGLTKQTITVYNNYFYVGAKGYYLVYAKSFITASGSYSPQSESVLVEYSLYNNGDGSEINPYQITTLSDFNKIAYNLEASYILKNNLDFNNNEFNKIGTEEASFVGNFNGNGFSFENVKIQTNIDAHVGVFGYIGVNGKIENLTVNVNINRGYYTGGIAGYNKGTISNCVVNGYIGTNFNYSQFTIYNGGIVGYNLGIIENCINNAQINPLIGDCDKSIYAGGIAGYNGASETSVILNCKNTGKVGDVETENISVTYSGGICGYNVSNITGCVNNGEVNSKSLGSGSSAVRAHAGGIVGYNGYDGTIYSCYNTANVIANSAANTSIASYVGGIVGYNAGNKTSGVRSIMYCMVIRQSEEDTLTLQSIARNSSDTYCGAIAGYNETRYSMINLVMETGIKIIRNSTIVYQIGSSENEISVDVSLIIGGGQSIGGSAYKAFSYSYINSETSSQGNAFLTASNFANAVNSENISYWVYNTNKLKLYWE